jgi:hypothetical protein
MNILKPIFILLFIFNCINILGQDTICSPGVKNIFDFSPGDIFQYYYQYSDFTTGIGIPIRKIEITNYRILDKEISGDTISYVRKTHKYGYTEVFNGPIDRTEEYTRDYTNTLVIIDSINHKLNSCQDSLILIDSNDRILKEYAITDTLFARTNIFSDGKVKKKFGGWDNVFVLSNNHLEPGPGDLNYEEVYAQGLGLIYINSWYFEMDYWEELTGYVKDGDTSSGFVADLELPSQALNQSVHIYPNPVKDELIILNHEKLNIKVLSIIDISGKQCFKLEPGTKDKVVINISELKKGLYFLSAYTEDNLIVKKILKR